MQPDRYTRSAREAADWMRFFDLVGRMVELRQDELGMDAGERILFVQEYPKSSTGQFDTKYDVVLYEVVSSQMAPTSPDGLRVPIGISLRERMAHPEKAGWLLELYGWWELVEARFTVLAKTNRRADEIARWFHQMMMVYGHGHKLFAAHGINYFRFLRRENDRKIDLGGQELYTRPLVYEARVEILAPFESKSLESLRIQAGGRTQEFVMDGISGARVPVRDQ